MCFAAEPKPRFTQPTAIKVLKIIPPSNHHRLKQTNQQYVKIEHFSGAKTEVVPLHQHRYLFNIAKHPFTPIQIKLGASNLPLQEHN